MSFAARDAKEDALKKAAADAAEALNKAVAAEEEALKKAAAAESEAAKKTAAAEAEAAKKTAAAEAEAAKKTAAASGAYVNRPTLQCPGRKSRESPCTRTGTHGLSLSPLLENGW